MCYMYVVLIWFVVLVMALKEEFLSLLLCMSNREHLSSYYCQEGR